MFIFKKTVSVTAHGEERTKRYVVDNGKVEYLRREKYCVRHGWIDVLAVGGDGAWHQHHNCCTTAVSTGISTKVLKVEKNKMLIVNVLFATLRLD
ncbi:MAG TPA: hypothetical protein VGC76_10435 [Pyrinomonadaceae bacterium]|jgi:hypothetical protein